MSLRAITAEFWRARAPRERAVLGIGATALLAALLYVAVWEPASSARARLSASLPRLRAQLQDMRQQQEEILALRRQAAGAAPQADLKAVLQGSIARSGFGKSVMRLDALSPQRVAFAAGPIDFDGWLAWVSALQRDFGMRIERCNVAAAGAGMVRVDATFAAGAATRAAP